MNSAVSEVLGVVRLALQAASVATPPPLGIIIGVVAEVLEPIANAIDSGASVSSVVTAIKAAMVATSNADMKAELGPNT